MNKLGRALLVTVIASSLIVTPVFAEPTVDELESGKAAVENEVSSLQAELTELLDKMGQLEGPDSGNRREGRRGYVRL